MLMAKGMKKDMVILVSYPILTKRLYFSWLSGHPGQVRRFTFLFGNKGKG